MHQHISPPPARRPITIEVDGEPQGVVIPAAAGVRFLAVRLSAFALDGAEFDSVEAARMALVDAVRNPSAPQV